jgi:adenosine kinase
MSRSAELRFADLEPRPALAVISPNDPAAMAAYVSECLQLGIPYFYDPSQQIVRLEPDQLRSGIMGARAVFVNDYEFGLLEEKTGLGLSELTDRIEWVTVTRGAAGADVFAGEAQFHVPALEPHHMIDPTGVGDAFRGGFCKGYLAGLNLERCAQMGVLAATYCLEHAGTQGHAFDLASFCQRFLRYYPDAEEIRLLR